MEKSAHRWLGSKKTIAKERWRRSKKQWQRYKKEKPPFGNLLVILDKALTLNLISFPGRIKWRGK